MDKRIRWFISLVAVVMMIFTLGIARAEMGTVEDVVAKSTSVFVEYDQFPDERFRAYVIESYDEDGDGYLDVDEIAVVSYMNVANAEIANLKGIECFTELEELDCSRNALIALNVRNNPKLRRLDCSGNRLTKITLSNNANLRELNCSDNQIEDLDLHSNSLLQKLDCTGNRLKKLDVSKNIYLYSLKCGWNSFRKLDLSNVSRLRKLVTKYEAEADGDWQCWGNGSVELTTDRSIDIITESKVSNAGKKNAVSVSEDGTVHLPDPVSLHVSGDVYRIGDFLYRVLKNKTVEIVEYLSEDYITDIPRMLAGYPVTAIGDNAFSNEGDIHFYTDEYPDYLREGIRRIHIPEGITRIGNYAFYNCFGLTEVTLPDSLQKIGEKAFAGCSILMDITLPDGLRELGDYAFQDCRALTEMNIPTALKTIGANPFAGCSHLRVLNVAERHSFLQFREGMLVDRSQQRIVACTKTAWSQRIVIPDDIHTIGEAAFTSAQMEEIVIPDSVTVIENLAFMDCKQLLELQLPKKLQQIGDNPLRGCYSLESVMLPKEQTRFSIRNQALIDEKENRLIAYLAPPKIEKVTTNEPEETQTMDSEEQETVFFYGVEMRLIKQNVRYENNEEEVTVEDKYTVPDGIRVIGASAFYGADIREMLLPETVTKIGQEAFAECKWLEICHLPQGVTMIPDKAFYRCSSLREAPVPDRTISIGNYAFAYTGITNMILPSSVVSIGRYTFRFCQELEQVILSSQLKTIPRGAFAYSGVNALMIPESVKEIEAEAFAKTNSMGRIQLPAGLKAISDFCFFDSAISEINIPSGVEYIGEQAFRIDDYHSGSMTEIVIPESVRCIGNRAFENESRLVNIFLPDSVAFVGNRAFSYCGDLAYIHWPKGVPEIKNDMFHFSGVQEIDIPDTVSYIGESAFWNTNLQEINLPDSVSYIGACALAHTHLQEIDLPDFVSFIGTSAFAKTDITRVNFPNNQVWIDGNPFIDEWYNGSSDYYTQLREIKLDVRHSNLKLEGNMLIDQQARKLVAYIPFSSEESCSVPDGIEILGASAFALANLSEIELPDSLRIIGNSAFYNCSKLKDIRIPIGVKEIGNNAFSGTSLTEIQLPDGLVRIGSGAFYVDSKITRIEIPDTVVFVGKDAFGSFSGIDQIKFGSGAIQTEGNPLAGGLDSIHEVIIPENHPTLALEDGNLYNKEDCRLIAMLGNKPIREGTIEIDDSAIRANNYGVIENYLVIPESVRRIFIPRAEFFYANYQNVYVVPGSPAEAYFESAVIDGWWYEN